MSKKFTSEELLKLEHCGYFSPIGKAREKGFSLCEICKHEGGPDCPAIKHPRKKSLRDRIAAAIWRE